MSSGLTPGERQRQYLDRMERARRIQEMEEGGALDPPPFSEREKRIARRTTTWALAAITCAALMFIYLVWGGY